jgi:hypothetical protein
MLKRLISYLVVALASVALTTVIQPFQFLPTQAQTGCQLFKQTGKTVCGRFLQYWQTHGGLAQQGYPLSNEFTEVSDLNGQPYTVQYFERAVFERHPENAAPYDVLLSQLGTFQFKRKYPDGEPAGSQPPEQSREQDFAIEQACTSSGELCAQLWTTSVQTRAQLAVEYEVPAVHCSSIRLHIFLDGKEVKASQWLGWIGASGEYAGLPLRTGLIDIGPVSPGGHTIGLQAEGQVSGCNFGQLTTWQGTLRVFTTP